MRLAGLLVPCALVASAAGAPRAGKVVRVERRGTGITGEPRFCGLQPSDMQANCFGLRSPEVGEKMVVLDATHVVGSVRVANVQGYADSCNQTTNWMVQAVAESGDTMPTRGYMLAFIDVDLDPRTARLVNVTDKSPTGHPWGTDQVYAIDNNGDGNPDIEFIQYPCDDFGVMSGQATSQCQEVWISQGNKGLERVRSEHVRICY